MKTILSYSIALVLSTIFFINSSVAQLVATDADPAVITITQQSPTDISPIGTNIAGNLTYTVQFNPFYNFISLVATSQFSVTYSDASNYVMQLTNSVPLEAGDVFDFYLNVKPTSNTTTPAGEIVTLNVDRTVPIKT